MTNPIIRMSESGKCPRALSAQLLGYKTEPAPPWLEQAATEGNWHEKRIKEELRAEGYTVFNEQKELKLEFPEYGLIGHCDGMVAQAGEEVMLLEVKSMSQYEFDRWSKGGFEEFPAYAAQLTCYLESSMLSKALYIVKNRNSGYTDKRFIYNYPIMIPDVLASINLAVRYYNAGQLAPVTPDLSSIECKRCAYKSLCIPAALQLTGEQAISLDKAVENYRLGKTLEAESEQLISQSREAFEQYMLASKLQQVKHKGILASSVLFKPNTTYPKKKLLQYFTEEQLEKAAEVKPAYNQLRITDLEARDGK